MSQDEQGQLTGQKLHELREKETELRCLQLRAGEWEKQYADTARLIGRGRYDEADYAALLALPSRETMHDTVSQMRSVTEQIQRLRGFLHLDDLG